MQKEFDDNFELDKIKKLYKAMKDNGYYFNRVGAYALHSYYCIAEEGLKGLVTDDILYRAIEIIDAGYYDIDTDVSLARYTDMCIECLDEFVNEKSSFDEKGFKDAVQKCVEDVQIYY